MRKIKVNYDQLMEVIAMHLESIGAIRTDEHVDLSPMKLEKGLLTVYVNKNSLNS